MLRRWVLPLLALMIVACGQSPAPVASPSGASHGGGLQDSTAAGAKYTLLHAWAPW